MPLAQIYVPEGVLTPEQKSEIIKGVTEVIASVQNIPPERRSIIYVLINEVPTGGWGTGGKPFVRRTPAAAPPAPK